MRTNASVVRHLEKFKSIVCCTGHAEHSVVCTESARIFSLQGTTGMLWMVLGVFSVE